MGWWRASMKNGERAQGWRPPRGISCFYQREWEYDPDQFSPLKTRKDNQIMIREPHSNMWAEYVFMLHVHDPRLNLHRKSWTHSFPQKASPLSLDKLPSTSQPRTDQLRWCQNLEEKTKQKDEVGGFNRLMTTYSFISFITACTKRTSPKEVIDNSNNLLIWYLDVGVLVQLPVFAVINQGVCNVTDVVLKVNH